MAKYAPNSFFFNAYAANTQREGRFCCAFSFAEHRATSILSGDNDVIAYPANNSVNFIVDWDYSFKGIKNRYI